MKVIALDLETLGTQQNAVITEIGAVVYDTETKKFGQAFHLHIDPDQRGRRITRDTLQFWLTQPTEVFQLSVSGGIPLHDALQEFSHWYLNQGNIDYVIYGPAGADIPWLQNAMEQHNVPVPWVFWQPLDVSSIKTALHMTKGDFRKTDIEFDGVLHNPVDDAKHLCKFFSYLLDKMAN